MLLNCLLLYARYIIYRGKYIGVGPTLVEYLVTIEKLNILNEKLLIEIIILRNSTINGSIFVECKMVLA